MANTIYPIGDSSFEYIRRNGQFYVDKTAYVYKMATESKYYFLSRPRRFGKSLLVSTLDAYFSGKRELFGGLEIERYETEWKRYPVMHFDFSLGNITGLDMLREFLNWKLSGWEEIYGRRDDETSLPLRFAGLVRRAAAVTGLGVVVLIDEYDNPLFSTMENKDIHEEIRDFMKGIYSVLKSEASNIRFCFLTGVTRFSKMSVFSGLNNLYDITLVPQYSGICGITGKELDCCCRDGIMTVAEYNGLDSDSVRSLLKENYDGYHFGDVKVDVYNPYSLIQVFANGRISGYWFVSGTSEFLWKRLRKLESAEALSEALSPVLDEAALGASADDGLSLEGLLFQTGYLTIKEDMGYGAYRLGIPNMEVRQGIMKLWKSERIK